MAAPVSYRLVEGVPHYRFHVSLVLTTGKRVRLVHWSPGYPWVRAEVTQRLMNLYRVDEIKPGSVTIRQEP